MRWKVFFTVLLCATLIISQSVKAQDDDSVTQADDEIINNDDYDVDTDVDTDVVVNEDTVPEQDVEEVISDDVAEPDAEEIVEEVVEEEHIADTESLEENVVHDDVENSDVIVSRMTPNVQPSSRSGNYADGLWLDNLDVSGNDANYNWGKLIFYDFFFYKESFLRIFL